MPKVNLLVRLAFCANVLLLLLAFSSATWTHALVMLPWAWILSDRHHRESFKRIIRFHKKLVALTFVLSLLIATGCLQHTCASVELESVFIPLLWIPVAAIVNEMIERHDASTYFTVCIAGVCIAGLILWQFLVESEPRPAGFSYNVLSSAMVLAIACLMAALHGRFPCVISKGVLYAAITLCVAASMATQAKTGLLTFIAASLAYLVARPHALKQALALILPIGLIWSISLMEKIQTVQVDVHKYQNKQYQTSYGERSDALRWATIHIADKPWLGRGAMSLQRDFNQRWQEWGRAKATTTFMQHLHNDYLQIGLSKGIPASLCFIGMWIGLMGAAIKKGKHQTDRSAAWVLSASIVCVTAFLTDSFTFWNFTWAAITTIYGIGAGLLFDRQGEDRTI